MDFEMSRKAPENNLSVCIVILNWNSWEDTTQCVSLLEGGEWPSLVVDNGSDDPREIERMRRAFPDLTFIETGTNLGYAGGMNVGMKWARASGFSHALLLNPDTLPSIGVIRSMTSMSAGMGIVGTRQVTNDAVNGGEYVSAANLHRGKPRTFTCADACGAGHEVDIVSGAALLIDLDVAAHLGYMDERFFHYKEEYDFCYRAHTAGHKIVYNCGVPLVHKRGGSLPNDSPIAAYYRYRNEILFLQKHFGRFGILRGLGIVRDAFISSFTSPDLGRWAARGILHGVRGISGPLFGLKPFADKE